MKLIEIACEVRRETDKAWLIFDGAREAWIAKSLGEAHTDARGAVNCIVVPEWLAKEKELI